MDIQDELLCAEMEDAAQQARVAMAADGGPYLPVGAWYDADEAAFACDFLELLPLSNGEGRLKLQDWQRRPLEQFYGTLTRDDQGRAIRQYQYLYQELPKKNGKTEVAAGLGLKHLLADGEERPEVYVCAADKDNASICFGAALYMIDHSPSLTNLRKKGLLKVKESQRTIVYKPNGGVFRVLSSEAYSKHGYKPSCVIFDELHAQPNRDLWDVMTFGAGDARQQPVWIVLTTAGDDPDRKSIGWEIHSKAMDILRARGQAPKRAGDDGMLIPCQDNPIWLPVIYGMSMLTGDDDEALASIDIYDERVWRACNPSLGVTVPLRVVRQEAREARRSEAAEKLFRWLRLNQWISVQAVGWLPLTLYDKTQFNRPEWAELTSPIRRQAVREWLRGKKCYGGVDLSTTTDLTAFTLIFPPQPGLESWVALFQAWRPRDGVLEAEQRDHVPYRDWERAGFITLCDGDMVDFGQVEDSVAQAASDFKLEILGVDPYMSRTLTPRLMDRGINVIEVPQTMQYMSPAMKELERLIRLHQMLHEHNTCARWTFGNVRCYVDDKENIRPMKNRSIGRIDITVAWIIAMAAAMVKMAEQPTLAERIEQGVWGM